MGPLIGEIAALARFPVKSMGGETLEEAAVGWNGLAGDQGGMVATGEPGEA
jgi:uncharacterized protein YcbX